MEFTDFRDSNAQRQTALVNQELDALVKLERTGRLPITKPQQPQAPAKAPQEAPAKASMGVTEGVKYIASETAKAGVGGLRNAAQSVIDLIYDATNLASDNLFDYHFQTPQLPKIAEPTGLGGKISKPLVQFAVPFTGALRALKPLAAGSTAKAAAAGAITDFAAFDPHEKRLSNLVLDFTKDNPSVAKPLFEYLAADDQDGNFEGRFKNALEGLGIGTAVDATIAGFKATKAYFHAKGIDPAEGIQQAAQADISKHINPGSGRSVKEQIEHITGVSKAPSKDRKADVQAAFKDDADVADHFDRQVKSKEYGKQVDAQSAWKADAKQQLDHFQERIKPTERVHLQDGKIIIGETQDAPKGLDLDTRVKAALEKNPVERDATDLIALRAQQRLQESLFEDILQPAVTGGKKVFDDAARKEATTPLILPQPSTKAMTDAERAALRQEMDGLVKQVQENNAKIAKAIEDASAPIPKKTKLIQGEVLDLPKSEAAPKVSAGGIHLSANPMFDPRQLLELAQTTGRLGRFLVRDPGDALSGAVGGTAGYTSADENASTEDKLSLALAGFLGGIGVHRAMGKKTAPLRPQEEPLSPVAQDLARPSVSGISPVRKAPVKLPKAKIDGIMQALQTGKTHDLAEALDTEDFNFGNIDTPEEAKELVNAFSKTFEKEISKAKGGVQTFGDIKELAEELGAGEKSLKALYGDTNNLSARVTSHRILLAASAKKVSELAREARLGKETDLLAFRKQVVLHATIQAEMKGVQTEIARALASFRIKADAEDLVVNEVNDLVQALGGREVNMEMAKKFAQATDAKKLHAMARKGVFARTQNAVFEMWVNGILSGPATHVVNTIGNSLVAIGSVAEKSVASAVGKVLRTQDRVTHEEVTAHLFGMMEGLKDTLKITADGQKALRQAVSQAASGDLKGAKSTLKDNADEFGTTYQSFADDAPIIDNALFGTKDFDQRKAISAEALGLDPDDMAGAFADVFGTLVRTPGRVLTATDELFKTIHYRGELKAQAYRQARREGLTGDALTQRIGDLVENPSPELSSMALDAARKGTFTNPLGDAGAAVLQAVNKVPGARYIMPFVRTPANIMNYVWERTPVLNAVNGRMRDDYLAGGVRRDMAIAKTAIGGSMYMLGGYLASQGIITGGGEKNQTAERLGGKQPYSVKVGDTYYAYNRMDPYGMFLGLAADFSHITGMLSEGEREDWVAASITALSKNLLSKSYLSGLVDLIDAITTSEQSSKPFERWLQRLGSSFVPFSSLQGAMRREVDPEVKEIWGYVDAIKARIPGLSDSVPPMRNLFGDVVHYSGGLGPDIASPVYSSTETDNPAAAEISRLNLDLQKPMKFIGGRGVPRIDLNQQQYDRLVQLAGNQAKIFDGLGFKDYLTQWVQSPEYQELSEGGQDFEGSKQTEIRFVYQLAKQAASAQLMEEYPELKRQHEKNMLNKGAALTGEAFQ